MATKIIDPGGTGDYTSLVSWEAATQKTTTEIELAECICTNGAADTGELTIDGWTISETNYLKIYVRPEYRHQGTIPSSGNIFRIRQTSTSIPFRMNESNIRIDGICFEYANTATSRDIFETISTTPSGSFYISNCIVANATNGSGSRAFDMVIPTGLHNQRYYFWNNIAINMRSYGFSFGGNYTDNYYYCYNNTVRNCGTAYRTYTVNAIFKNNIAQDCAVECWGTSGIVSASVYNNTDNDAVPGSNQITGEVTFVDESNRNLLLSKTDTIAKGSGINLCNDVNLPFDYDILGNRRGYIWDLGAHQVTVAANYQMII